MGLLSGYLFSRALNKLTAISKAEALSSVAFADLPAEQQNAISRKCGKCLDRLEKYPRHLVTREMLERMRLSLKFNLKAEYEIEQELLFTLIRANIALDIPEYEKSYGR